MPRGKGQRCSGYLSSDGRFAFCSREEHAGRLEPQSTDPTTFRHLLEGDCFCGRVHGHRSTASNRSEYIYTDETGTPLFRVVRVVTTVVVTFVVHVVAFVSRRAARLDDETILTLNM